MAYSRPFPAPPTQPYAPVTSQPFRAPAPAAPPPAAAPPASSVPAGTLPPGTLVEVGQYRVTVQRFLSEGGFAHVYLAQSAVPLPPNSPTATTQHVLKRMVVPDKRGVEEVGREVDVMRQLKNHPKIVNMIEASVADLPGGVDGSKGYEIYILMEWCQGGGIIDMMNTRLQNRLTEGEILKIFSDVVEAVAHMHYQSPPLIHRDLKVENILLSPPQTYKLCDFGSTTRPLPRDKVPTTVEGIQKLEHSINKTTTLQYRAPELVDVWGRKGFDEKIDIWALGVFLYKLCFYTTPFEEHGPLAILNAQYKFPAYPAYSSSIRSLIGAMLQERASQRPNIYQVHEMTCRLRGVPVRLENKYALGASSFSSIPALAQRGPPHPPASPHASTPLGAPSSLPVSPLPTAGILSSSPHAAASSSGSVPGLAGMANQVTPMRRGRPGKAAPSSEPVAVPERQVRTGLAEWHQGGERAEKDRPSVGMDWNGFGAPAAGGVGGAASAAGFGDAFTPAAPAKLDPSATAGAALETSVELPRNAGMFAALAGRGGPGSPMALDEGGKEGAGPSGKEDDGERRRFEESFPAIELDGPLDSLPAPAQEEAKAHAGKEESMSAAAPLGSTSLIDASSPPASASAPASATLPPQLTGEQPSAAPGPPLPRRPPTASPSLPPAPAPKPEPHRQVTKPGLVSRGSQTSPHLMASWRPQLSALSSSSSSPASSGAAAPPPPQQPSTLRQSSIPELALENSDEPGHGKPVVDLLGDDDAPTLQSLTPVLRATPSPTPQGSSDTFASKRASFLGAQTSSSSASSASNGPAEREKFRPVTKRMSLSPAGSPKPALAPAPAPNAAPRPEPEREQSVEERFPALSLGDEVPPAPAAARPANGSTEFERVVEKEEDDSSDDEQSGGATSSVGAKVAAPAFDDDDFAPRKPVAERPSFSARASSSIRLTTSSPPPLERKESTRSAASASVDLPSRQFSTASSASNGDGGIDLGPALASIRKFAPQGNGQASPSSLLDEQDHFAPSSAPPKPMSPPAAPLVAPKPQPAGRKQAINSLVSRYEGLGSALTGGPPPVGVKPVGLRKDSTGSSTGSGAAHSLHTREAVRPQRLPQWGAAAAAEGAKSPVGSIHSVHSVREVPEDNPAKSPPTMSPPPVAPKPSTPTSFAAFGPSSTTARAPFKPTPPPGSPSSPASATIRPSYGIHASRPSFGSRAPPSSTSQPPAVNSSARPLPPSASSAAPEAGEEEQRFAGVSNMKSRWESMNRAQEPQQGQGRAGGGPSGSAAAKRRSWAQI
ncbi:hypothetical protein JCM8208_005541 [Rhodotorula glutinis]